MPCPTGRRSVTVDLSVVSLVGKERSVEYRTEWGFHCSH